MAKIIDTAGLENGFYTLIVENDNS